MSLMAEMNRNTSIREKGLWEWDSEPIKPFEMVFSISRRKGAAR